MRNTLLWVGLAIVVTGAILLVAADAMGSLGSAQGDRIVSLVAMTALLVVVGGGAISSYSGRSGTMLRHLAIWLAIIAVIALLYNYRAEFGLPVD